MSDLTSFSEICVYVCICTYVCICAYVCMCAYGGQRITLDVAAQETSTSFHQLVFDSYLFTIEAGERAGSEHNCVKLFFFSVMWVLGLELRSLEFTYIH